MGAGRWSSADDRPDVRRVVGLLVGLAGVSALVGFEVGSGDVWSVIAVFGVSVCYAVGPVILARWLSGQPGLGVITVSLLVSALIYLPIGVSQLPAEMPSGKVVWAVVGLAVICTAIAFVVFFELIAEVGPSRATVITYLNPAVALLLGMAILDESFTVATAVGFTLILAGSVLATRSRGSGTDRVRRSRSSVDSDCEAVASPVAEP
ncbi:MAG: DMT family transporter [Sporichthyaceae bacterium]